MDQTDQTQTQPTPPAVGDTTPPVNPIADPVTPPGPPVSEPPMAPPTPPAPTDNPVMPPVQAPSEPEVPSAVPEAPEVPATPEPPAAPEPETPVPAADATASAEGAGEDTQVTIGKYKVKVVRHLCIGAASCVAVSPNVFALDGSNIAVFKDGGSDSDDNIMAAAQSCPTKAIELYDASTGAKAWPL